MSRPPRPALVLSALAGLALLLPAVAAAQDLPIKWGKITDAERALTAADGDPDAAAVVLGDVGVGEVRYDRARDDFGYRSAGTAA